MKESFGCLLYRYTGDQLEVLLVHPSGNYNRKAPWSIPKGLAEASESLEETARRETLEETGVAAGDLTSLGSIQYVKSRKRVYCFTGAAPSDATPRCAQWEVDRAEFVGIAKAYELLHPDQRPFLDHLQALLTETTVLFDQSTSQSNDRHRIDDTVVSKRETPLNQEEHGGQ